MDITQFWDGWEPILHTLITATIGFLALMLMLRLSGARSMASMTPLDFIVAVTIGSAFGRTLTAVDVPLAQAILTLAVLLGLQWAFGWLRRRSPVVRRLMDAPPVLLFYRGEVLQRALRRHQLVEDDVYTAARQAGHGSMDGIAAVILQQDGSLGVITDDAFGDGSTVLPFVQESRERAEHLGDHTPKEG